MKKYLTYVLMTLMFLSIIVVASSPSRTYLPSDEKLDVLTDVYNATKYEATNFYWDNGCYYYSLEIGTWKDTHREVVCSKDESIDVDSLVELNIKTTLVQLSVVPEEKTNTKDSKIVKEDFTNEKAVKLKSKINIDESKINIDEVVLE